MSVTNPMAEGYTPTASQMAGMLEILQREGSVVIPGNWDMERIVGKITDIAPPGILVRGRKQAYLGFEPREGYKVIHMAVDLESDHIVVEHVERQPQIVAQFPVGRTYITHIDIPTNHREAISILTRLDLSILNVTVEINATHYRDQDDMTRIEATGGTLGADALVQALRMALNGKHPGKRIEVENLSSDTSTTIPDTPKPKEQ